MAGRNRSGPLRYEIRDRILELLVRIKSSPGDQIPTEQELMDILNVSRSTLREGLHLLEEERVIRTRHGSGRYLVANPKDFLFEITRLQSVTEMLRGYGIEGKVRLLDVVKMSADEEIANHLEIEVETPVVAIERLRLVDEVPIIYSIDMIPEEYLNNGWKPEDFEGSLLKTLEERHRVYLDYSRAEIRVLACDNTILKGKIDYPPNVPWILLEQVNYNNLDQPVIYSKDYHRGDYIVFNVRRVRY